MRALGRWRFVAVACVVAGAAVSARAGREAPGVRVFEDDSERVVEVSRRRLLQETSTPFLNWLSSLRGDEAPTPLLDWLTTVSRASGGDAPTPVLDWLLARQSGGDTGTPILDGILDVFIGTQDTLFGPTSFTQRVTNRISTYLFSELLRFDFDYEERQTSNENRASMEQTTWNSTFAKDLFEFVDAEANFGYEHLNLTKFIEDDVCGSAFLRADLDVTALDDAYYQAAAFTTESVPRGCYTGCIIGTGTYEALARAYGVRRSFNFNSWRGKCFDELDPSSVTNLIQLNYGPVAERIFPRLASPIELYPGDAEVASSNFHSGADSIVVDYSAYDHDFTFFRDELRPVYSNVYVGKMYAMPGMSMFGGVLQVPIGAAPVFTVNFLLVGEAEGSPPLTAAP